MLKRIKEMPPPDIVDDFGTKWWLDKSASDYASRADARGKRLGAEVWFIEELNGLNKFVLVQNQRVLFECENLNAMGIHIDSLKRRM